jgi:transposase
VHGGLETFGILMDLLNAAKISLKFLPCYSPELNPCELVFMKVKRHLREYRNHQIPLWFDIAGAFSTILLEDLQKFYNKCVSL